MAKAKNWMPLVQEYRGKWVALAEDEMTVLASGATAKEAHEGARTSLHYLYRVPDTLDAFAGYEV